MRAKGQGVGALMDMTTSFTLSEDGAGTSMAWEADVKIAGPVGAMGQRVLQPIVNQQVSQVLAALEQRVGDRRRISSVLNVRADAAPWTTQRSTRSSVWLETMWPRVRQHLVEAPAHVLEIGCGPAGGFVPMFEESGYAAVGVDPEAPTGPQFVQARFEDGELADGFDIVVACTSLHHVDDPRRSSAHRRHSPERRSGEVVGMGIGRARRSRPRGGPSSGSPGSRNELARCQTRRLAGVGP